MSKRVRGNNEKGISYGMTNLTGGVKTIFTILPRSSEEYFSLIFSSTLNLWLLKKR